ncbi:MAG: hypothetical protein ACT4O2_07035, partial [Beijerinckiaceae bacterium]
TSMKPESLKRSILIKAEPIFDIEIQKPILPHNSVEGWAIFDIAKGFTSPATKYYKIEIRDSAGAVSSTIIKTPLRSKGENDTGVASISQVGTSVDLSGAYVKLHSNP